MSISQLRLRGEKAADPAVIEVSEYYSFEQSYSVSPATRSDAPEQRLELKEEHLIEIVLEDDTVWIGTRDTLEELFPEAGVLNRGDSGEWVLPSELTDEVTDRSIFKKVALKVVNLFVKKQKGAVMEAVIGPIAKKLEEKQFEGIGEGLYRLSSAFDMTLIDKPVEPGDYLLFIHGTGSSSKGSFSELKGSDLWKQMQQMYKAGNILALQHRTLTENPLSNIKKLVEKLPAEANIDLISHSRGGLVADLLCRFAADARGFDSDEINCLQKEGRTAEIATIREIERLIRGKKITIRRQIRVACPARGTILAGRRIHDFFNITMNLLGVVSGQVANPAYVAFKELILALIETKDNTRVLPGIEAQNPESPFIKALNYPGSTILIPTPLMVIAGNSRVSLKLKGLLVIASKLFYREANDLVVNTVSMFKGARRQSGKSFYYLEQSGETNHFTYFTNESSRLAITNALQYTGEGRLPMFEPIKPDMRTLADRNAVPGLDGGKVFIDNVTGKRPIVVMLPGIMGSNLQVKDNIVWINYLKFLTGELTALEYAVDNNRHIKAHSLIRSSYKKLADYLSSSYDVVTFPFDWRKPLDACTEAFDMKIRELMRYNQPIRIIGHSMGGVLVRDFILSHTQTWEELNSRPGFRLLFLGSPLGGSYRIPFVLFGFDDIIKKLAAIDICNSKKDLLKVFSNMPGLLSLLPLANDADNDFSDIKLWEKLREGYGDKDWPIPAPEVLKHFGEYRKKILEQARNIDYKNVVYIAGACRKGKSTPCGYLLDRSGSLNFVSTTEGDESVTWATGIPAELAKTGKVYYSNVTHGELANDTGLFPAISEALQKGETSRLRTTPPAVRGAEKLFISRAADDLDFSEEGVENTLLGLSGADTFQSSETPLNVAVTNGDLGFARYPVLVGHFAHDGIISAEWVVDKKLGGEISRRHRLGLHPGIIGDNEVILTDKAMDGGFQGALIVGLGIQGELTGYALMQTIEKGIAKYLSILNVKGENQAYLEKRPKIGISTLVIGGSYGGLSIESSIRSVLLGIQNANRNIRATYGADVRLIEEVEVIELYRDRALSAITAIRTIERDENRSLNIVLTGKTTREKLGQQVRIPLDTTSDWWTRITVRREDEKREEPDKKPKRRTLVMTISTTGAREEKRTLLTASETLFRLIEDMSTRNQWTSCHGKTLFELLVPNDFKEQVKRQGNINWIVDKYAAAIPWELMQDTSGHDQPLCVHAGMIRQLATQDYRIRIQAAPEKRALVIADPDLQKFYGQLPGALEEGKQVFDLLASHNYATDQLFNSTATDIFKAIMCTNYRVIHLAGHGVFNPDDPSLTGMVIGKDAFLTVAEIAQMGTVPELVFVNCCYLGQTDANTEELTRDRYQLAANIGTQLIENGVKAVVAAGWAIDDSAALIFAGEFYHQMLAGNTFGEAVKKARKKVYEEHGNRTNTWGAYQCYGDPFFKLDDGKFSSVEKDFDFVMPEEAEYKLVNLINQIESGNSNQDRDFKALQKIIKAVESAGISTPLIREREARVLVLLERYEEAIEKFRVLASSEKSDFSFSALELFVNTRVKYINKELEQKGNEWASAEMDGVIEDLNALNRFGKTSERLSLLGSAHKRQIGIYGSRQKQKALRSVQAAAVTYQEAFEKLKIAYPLNNWIQFQAIFYLHTPGTDKQEMNDFQKKAQVLLTDYLDKYEAERMEINNFWEKATYPNLLLSKYLMGLKGAEVKKVAKAYRELWDWAGTDARRNTEIAHLKLIELALGLGGSEAAKKLREGITTLIEELSSN